MQVAELNEPIKVRADFLPGGEVQPRLFRRGHRTFRVTNVNATWEDTEGQHALLYLTVTVSNSDDVFQLCFREEDRTWWLQQVMMEG